MRNSCWIALDLLGDAGRSAAFLVMAMFLAIWLPLQAGIMDALTAGLFLAPGMRQSLVMNASWPALAMVGVQAHVFLPRRLGREVEPLLALPVTDYEFALGLSLPGLVAAVLSAPLLHLLNLAGYRIAGGRFPGEAYSDFVELWLATLLSGLWLGAAALHGSLHARSQAGFSARVILGYGALALLDAQLFLMRWLGIHSMVAPVLGAGILAGIVAHWLIARGLDRESLILRR